jgi:alkylation response protein AidB-like acyl-CoA dehydrogenase
VEYTKETIIDGQPLSKNPSVRQKLAHFATELEVGELLYYQPAWISGKGRIPSYEASMQKLFASEMIQRLANTGMQIMGFYGQLQRDSKWSQLKGKMEYHYRDSILRTIAAGTSEIQRNIIAQAGLGLPRR